MRTDCIKHLNKLISSIQDAVNSGLIDLKDLDDDGVVGEVFDEEGCYAESDKL